MPKTEIYETTVSWTGGQTGHVRMGNGPEMDFSAPPQSHGRGGRPDARRRLRRRRQHLRHADVHLGGRAFRLDLASYECRAEGTKLIELDRTEIFTQVVLKPRIVVRAGNEPTEAVEKRVRRALESAQKYSLVANSVKSKVIVEPEILIDTRGGE